MNILLLNFSNKRNNLLLCLQHTNIHLYGFFGLNNKFKPKGGCWALDASKWHCICWDDIIHCTYVRMWPISVSIHLIILLFIALLSKHCYDNTNPIKICCFKIKIYNFIFMYIFFVVQFFPHLQMDSPKMK